MLPGPLYTKLQYRLTARSHESSRPRDLALELPNRLAIDKSLDSMVSEAPVNIQIILTTLNPYPVASRLREIWR